MNESIVQWTLLNNLGFLSNVLDFNIAKKRGQEITTEYGRIDFVVEDFETNQLIVELETILNTANKLEYCFNQIISYKNIPAKENSQYCLLYAVETKQQSKPIINRFGQQNDVLIRSYSLNDVRNLYADTVKRLSLSFGLVLPEPKNYTICYLRWLNKILKPFYDNNIPQLSRKQTARYFTSPNSTNFRCYLRLALDFEMIAVNNDAFLLTDYGNGYVSNFNPDIETASNLSALNLNNEQKKVLLRVITNGNWTPHKVNIYWFLRFLEVNHGEWIPNIKHFDKEKLDLLNGLFGVNYKSRTMYEFLNFACNWCLELGLVERIKTNTHYDRVYFTPLGIEINNIFSLDLQIKKNRMNLNFKYLD